MRARLQGQHGMSLVEATIILMVLAILTAVVAPSIGDYVNDAKHTKAKEDVEAIGTTIMRLTRDVGPCLKLVAATACTKANRVDILVSNGPTITTAFESGNATTAFTNADITSGALNWHHTANRDTMQNQFVLNAPLYGTPATTTPTGYTLSGPQGGLGWRGSYIDDVIGPDPWGNQYVANTAFLSVASDATAGTAEGNASGGWSRDVIVVSMGPNALIETAIAGFTTTNQQYVTRRGGDDLVYTVTGDTR